MIPPSLGSSWVLIRNGKAPPALAHLTRERVTFSGPGFFCDLMVAETSSTTGRHEWRKRREYEIPIHAHDILFVFPCAPSPSWVAEARRELRRQQQT
jgi:hypothetical protein